MPYKSNEARRAAESTRKEELAARARAWRAVNREKYNQQAAKRRASNREAINERARAAYQRDPEVASAVRHSYYVANPDRHRDVARQAHARRMARDPEIFRAWVRNRAARERSAQGICSAAEWKAVLQTYGVECLRCRGSEDITQDHVIPLARGGTNWPWNLQPLCRVCNSAKGARSSKDYRPDKGQAIRALLVEAAA